MKKTPVYLAKFLVILLTGFFCFPVLNTPARAAGSTFVKAYACDSRVIALKSDGTVWIWGRNDVGGNTEGPEDTAAYSNRPVRVQGISDAMDVSAGIGFNVVLKRDGSVWAWGRWGRSLETDEFSASPVKVEGFRDIKAVTAANDGIMALKKDGTVWMIETNPLLKEYGGSGDEPVTYDQSEVRNSEGYDGHENESESKTPYQVKNLTKVKRIQCVGDSSEGILAAIREDGTVWTWGEGEEGPLGHAAAENSWWIPAQVKGIAGVDMLSGGYGTVYALKTDGTVWTWGGVNLNGGVKYRTPVKISALSGVGSITTVESSGTVLGLVFVKKDGTVWTEDYSGYRKLANIANGKAISAGRDFALILARDGTLWSVGNNDFGQLGNGYYSVVRTPVKLASIDNVSRISTGTQLTTAVRKDGGIWNWGTFTMVTSTKQSHTVKNVQRLLPVKVSGFDHPLSVAGGSYTFGFLNKDGSVWTCGDNSSGEIGDGTGTHREKLTRVSGLKNAKELFTMKAGGYGYFLALLQDGTLSAWGNNYDGQLGDGTKKNRYAPVQVKGLSQVASAAPGGRYSLALKKDGTVWAWGLNLDGCLGANIRESLVPVRIKELSDITAIAAGRSHAVALKKDGTVWTWGYNGSGELGIDSKKTEYQTTPVKVEPIRDVVAIAAGDLHTLALKSDGTVWAWGNNEYWQLGHENVYTGNPETDTNDEYRPMQVENLSDITAIDAAGAHGIALKKDGTVWVWGRNQSGQPGTGGGDVFAPARVVN